MSSFATHARVRMRISTVLTLGLGIVSTCILGSHELWRYAQEKLDLQQEAERSFRTLSAAVVVAVENSLRDQQDADIREILDSIEADDPTIDVYFIGNTGNVTPSSSAATNTRGGAPPFDGVWPGRMPGAGRAPIVRLEGLPEGPRLIGLFPLQEAGDEAHDALVIVRPLPTLVQDLARTRNSAIFSCVALILGITFIGWLLLDRYVRRPLEGLAQALEAVRKGNLSGSLPIQDTHELGTIALQFNTMIRELEQARGQVVKVAEEREILEQALRRVDKLITVGQLSAGIAHEIGSPLQVLSGRARSLAMRSDLPPDVARAARIIEEQTVRIVRIVEQLLDFTRRKAPHMADIDIAPSIASVVAFLEGEARRRGARMEFEARSNLPKITADTNQVQQVVMNLLTNALRASPRDGRIHLTLSESVFFSAGGTYEQPSVLLTVEDEGHGMADGILSRIFEPFYTTWTDASGTGLGLAVVKSVVEEHGGTIHVASTPGKGTKVLVHFPISGRGRQRGLVA